EARERMERVALDRVAGHGRVQELQVEEGVVPDENRPVALLLPDLLADLLKQPAQRVRLVERGPQRMVRIDAGDLQRRGLEIRARKRLHEIAPPLGRLEVAVLVHAHDDGRDLEQRVRRGVETAGLDVDDDRQEASEPLRDRGGALRVPVRLDAFLRDRRRMLAASAHWSAIASTSSDGCLPCSSSTVSRTPKPVMSVGTCASPPLCSPADRSTCTHAIDFGTKRDRKRAASTWSPCESTAHCLMSAMSLRRS